MKAPVVENPQGFGNDERRYTPVTEFEARSNNSIHRKLREERKAPPHKSLYSEEIIRPGTQITRIGRIYTDNKIRAYPCHPCNPCSIVNDLKGEISHQWFFYPVIEQGVAQ